MRRYKEEPAGNDRTVKYNQQNKKTQRMSSSAEWRGQRKESYKLEDRTIEIT